MWPATRRVHTVAQLVKISILLASLVSLPVILSAQDPAPLKVRTETNAVQVDVAVRDAKGQPVPALTRDDFKITDAGKPRPIQIFSDNRISAAAPTAVSTETPAAPGLPSNVFSNRDTSPRVASHSTVILLDGVNGWFENFTWSRKAVIGLMDKAPRDERIAVYAITGNQGLVVVQDYTSDRDLLIKSVSSYVAPGLHPSPAGGGSAPPKRAPPAPQAPAPPNATKESPRETEHALHLASENVRESLEALAARLGSIPGRKSIFWLTQGFPATELRGMGKAPWEKTFAALKQANVAVNAVDSNGLGGPPRRWGRNTTDTMQQIADETGGVAYLRRNDLDEALAEGIQAARDSYTLGFYLADEERDGKFHKLAVSTGRPNLQLQYRPGYFAAAGLNLPPTLPADPSQWRMSLESVLLSPVDLPAIGITAEVAAEPAQHATIRLHIDIATLKLNQTGDISVGKFDEMFLELDEAGHQLGKISDTQELQIPESQLAAITSRGVVLTKTIPLAEGTSRLSIIVRDTATGQVGRLTVPLVKLPK